MFVNCIIKCITWRYTFLYVYVQFSLALYKTETELYTSVYKAREASKNGEWRARFLGERRWQILANVCYGAQLNQTPVIPFNLGYLFAIIYNFP